ncbi:MAG TPA: GNAT family N-acetyltransferase [Ensifer sp.]|jgi:N-acetylglutamate synthase-like GNAT family acetyltransferase|uniref:GNAT family N-acetyltransferase n=1 Tax=Ensifer sp. TaxID=1872086 RepID=UPI002E1483A1|nr:GNAT family N-acetyltransferase [Ensifer sp.]
MQANIRQATVADHQRLETLQRLASLATREHRQALLDNPEVFGIAAENIAHSLVAELDGHVVGFCTVLPVSADLAEVDAIFIDPDAWREGIGRMLLTAAEQRAAVVGTKALVVTSSGQAVSFYRALGFQPASVSMTDFGPAERLTKQLA